MSTRAIAVLFWIMVSTKEMAGTFAKRQRTEAVSLINQRDFNPPSQPRQRRLASREFSISAVKKGKHGCYTGVCSTNNKDSVRPLACGGIRFARLGSPRTSAMDPGVAVGLVTVGRSALGWNAPRRVAQI